MTYSITPFPLSVQFFNSAYENVLSTIFLFNTVEPSGNYSPTFPVLTYLLSNGLLTIFLTIVPFLSLTKISSSMN
jgi:hypothetical protein